MTTRVQFFLLSVLLAVAVQCAACGWRSTFSEEFAFQTELDSAYWIPSFHWSPDSLSNERQTYLPALTINSTMGTLDIKAWYDSKAATYYSGVISSKDRFNQLFGYFEFQARLPTATGVLASFSLLSQDTTAGNYNGVNIIVVLSNPRKLYFTQKCGNRSNQNGPILMNLTNPDMHTFGMDWLVNATYFYIDGQLVTTLTNCIDASPVYLAANLAVTSSYSAGTPNPSAFPVTMNIDYIRAYQMATRGGFNITGPGAGSNLSPLITATPRVTVGSPSISRDVARLEDIVTFNVTITGGGDKGSPTTLSLDQAVAALSIYPMLAKQPLAYSTQFTNITLAQKSSVTFSITAPSLTAGYYRIALDLFEANGTKIIGLNTVQLFQVLPAPLPPTVPVSPPVTPPIAPVSPPVATVVTNVIPILDCYAPINATHYRAYLSYENKNNVAVSLPVGSNNKITPGSMDRGQPTVFTTGRSALFPNSVFTTDVTNNIEWVLSSYTVNVDITDTSSLCQSSVTIVIVVSSPTPINSTNVSELKDVIASQLNVTSDNVQINVTCTTATNCEISVTISADPSQVSDLIQKAKEYATDPATVENTVKQVSTDLSVTEVRGTKTNTEKQGTSNPMPMSQPIPSNALKTDRTLLAIAMLSALLALVVM